MKNIEYLEQFFRKHKLSGRTRIKYTNANRYDDYMSDIILEDGTVININDVIFDIESEFPEQVAEKWMKEKDGDISLIDWIKANPGTYMTFDVDNTGLIEYQREMEGLVSDLKDKIENMFKLQTDEGDSDYGESESGE